jgi:SAM-dependent MidA family methyltransferase
VRERDGPSVPRPSLDAAVEERARAVVRRVAGLAGADGFLPFDRFMEVALYGEGTGYYTREATPFGPAGDYYTAPRVSPLFGRTIAARIRAVRAAVGPDRPFRVVEVGGGDGTLATTVLEALAPTPPGLEYVIVELSPSLGTAAMERIERSAQSAGIPARLATSVGADGPFEGFVLANELLDAQPVRRLRWTGDAWREIGVRVKDEALVAAEADLNGPIPGPPLPSNVAPGTVVEISPGAEAVVREVADHLTRGAFAVIDYGMEESELLAAHPRGTLENLRHHRVVADPLAAPGSSDLSVFVNFTRIREVARRAGLVEIRNCSQAEALGDWGFPELLATAIGQAPSAEAEVRTRLAAKNLLFGFERFRALEWAARDSVSELSRPT